MIHCSQGHSKPFQQCSYNAHVPIFKIVIEYVLKYIEVDMVKTWKTFEATKCRITMSYYIDPKRLKNVSICNGSPVL
jgi:hypothetical protein